MSQVNASTLQAIAHLSAYIGRFPAEAGRFSALQRQLGAPENIFDRANMRGHITCSAIVLNAARTHVLVIHHNVFKREMPPGGHDEEAEDLIEAARREVLEETGISDITLDAVFRNTPFDIDTHAIEANPLKAEGEHWHHDYTYLFQAEGNEELLAQLSEVSYAAWRRVEDFAKAEDSRLSRLGAKILELTSTEVAA